MNEKLFNRNKNIPFLIQISKTSSDFYKTPKYLNSAKHIKKITSIKRKFSTRKKLLNRLGIDLSSFHHSILTQKILTNPQYIQMKTTTCQTDREYNTKNRIAHNNNLFLTKILQTNSTENTSDLIKNNNNNNKKTFKTIFYGDLVKNNNNNNFHSSIPTQVFLNFNLKKYEKTNYPDILTENASDFVDEIKTIRKMNLINNLRKEAKKFKECTLKNNIEKYELNVYSLIESKKLLKFYSKSFIGYHKFLLETIKKENKNLKKLISEENELYNEVKELYHKTNNIKLELQVIKNYKNLLEKILSYKKKSSEKPINLRRQDKKKTTKSTDKKKTFIRYSTFKGKIHTKLLKTSTKNLILNTDYFNDQDTNSINIKPVFNKKKYIRQPDSLEKSSPINIVHKGTISLRDKKLKTQKVKFNIPEKTKLLTNDFKSENSTNKSLITKNLLEDVGIFQKELGSIEKKIVKSIYKYTNLDSKNTELIVKVEKNNNQSWENNNKMIQKYLSDIDSLKNDNECLKKKLKELANQKDDNTFFNIIFKKLKQTIYDIAQNEFPKEFEQIFIELKNLSTINPLKDVLPIKIKNVTIKYIYKYLLEIENLLNLLINSKNELNKNVEIHKDLREIQKRMASIKKLEKNKKKKYEEFLKRELLAEKTIKKMNKTFYKPIKPVPEKYNLKKLHHNK